MAAATAFCTSNTAFYQHALATARPQYPSVPRRSPLTTLSSSPSSSPTTLSSQFEQQPLSTHLIKSDENNNHPRSTAESTITDLDDVLYITSDDDDNNDDDYDIHEDGILNGDRTECEIDQARFLSMVGLRMKTKAPTVPTHSLPVLTKRVAYAVCLLPLPKHSDRVRQALYLRLPSLKFLKFTRDIDRFCSTDESARALSLLPRSLSRTRAVKTIKKHRRRHKLSKSALINQAAVAIADVTGEHSMNQYVHSILQCHVALDRMDQSAIDRLMHDTADSHGEPVKPTSTEKSPPRAHRHRTPHPSVTTTQEMTTTTMSSEKLKAKRKSTSEGVNTSKRFKAAHRSQEPSAENEVDMDALSSPYKRIYLKCFVCSKRDYIDAQAINSDVLHSHWLDHGGSLSLNIYDAEIDSILTRVVEFFNSPKRHTLEGKIKTVFILNSKEIRHSLTNDSSPLGSCIIID